jgi:N-acetylglutamate synthase
LIKDFEELSMNAWPSLQTKLYDGWILRFADGYTRRANSVSPIYKSTISIDEKIDFCEKEYRLCNLPTLFKLTSESNPDGIDTRLEERGYVRYNETALRILDLSQYVYYDSQGLIIESKFNNEWLEGFFYCSNILMKKYI